MHRTGSDGRSAAARVNRREFVAALAAAGGASLAAGHASGAWQAAPGPFPTVKLLVFDTFGTVVDWRGSVIREGEQLGRAKRLTVDWAAFADAWRGG